MNERRKLEGRLMGYWERQLEATGSMFRQLCNAAKWAREDLGRLDRQIQQLRVQV
jgi:hypothetical protein